jgi:hypothetical protein
MRRRPEMMKSYQLISTATSDSWIMYQWGVLSSPEKQIDQNHKYTTTKVLLHPPNAKQI